MAKTVLPDPRDDDEILADTEILSAATGRYVLYTVGARLLYYNAERQRGEGWENCQYEIGIAVYDDGEYNYYYDDDAGAVLDLAKLRAAIAGGGPGYEPSAGYSFGNMAGLGTFAEMLRRMARVDDILREYADDIKTPSLIHITGWGLMKANAATLADGFPLPADFRNRQNAGAGVEEIYAVIIPPSADSLAPLRAPRVDLFIALSHTIGTSLKYRRRGARAAAGVEVKVIDDAGRENQITGAAVFTLVTLLRYVAEGGDPFVWALWRQRAEIWVPGAKALYKYCFADVRRTPTHADRLRIRRGIEDLQKRQLVVYKEGGRLIPIERPWARVEKTPLTAARARVVGVAFSNDDEARITEGVIFTPDAALDLIADNGFIKVWPDLNDRLVAAFEKTKLEITVDRVAFIIDLAKTLGEIADGCGGGDYAVEPGRYVIRRTPAALVKILGLESVRRRRHKADLAKKIEDALTFARAGGFIESYTLKDNIYNLVINRRTERLLALPRGQNVT